MAQKKRKWQRIHLNNHEVPCILLQTKESTKGITPVKCWWVCTVHPTLVHWRSGDLPQPPEPMDFVHLHKGSHLCNTVALTGIPQASLACLHGEKMRNKHQAMLPDVCKGARINSVPYLGGKSHGILVLVDLLGEPSHMHTLSIKSCIFSLPRNAIFLWVLISYWTCKRFDPRQFTSHTWVNI